MNSKLMLSAGAVVIVVLALAYGMRTSTSDNVKPVTGTPAGVAASAPPAANNAPADNMPAPWANGSNSSALQSGEKSSANVTGLSDGHNNTKAPGKKLTAAELQKFQDELLGTVQSGNPDPKRLKEILTRLKQTQGNTVGGVNVDVLLNNLEKSQQIQDVAAQLQKESQKPGGPDQKKMQDYMDSLKKLQAQMRTDVMVASPAMPMQAK